MKVGGGLLKSKICFHLPGAVSENGEGGMKTLHRYNTGCIIT